MRSVARLLSALFLGALLLGFLPSASAQTSTEPKCFINGGSVYPGCVPAKLVFYFGSQKDPVLYIDPWGDYFVENDVSKFLTCVRGQGFFGNVNNIFC